MQDKQIHESKKSSKQFVNFSDPLTPRSWAVHAGVVYILELLILNPRWYEFLVYFLTDALLIPIAVWAVNRLYSWKNPSSRDYFPKASLDDFSDYTLEQKVSFLESLLQYPVKYSRWCLTTSIPKALPGTLIILFFWSYSHSIWTQLVFSVGITATNFVFFRLLVYLEGHQVASKFIRDLHERYNWQDAFKKLPVSDQNMSPRISKPLILTLPAISTVLYQIMLIYAHREASHIQLALLTGAVGFGAVVLFSRSLLLWNRLVVGGLNAIFDEMRVKRDDQVTLKHGLPYHTYPILRRSQKIFNDLYERIAQSERELSVLVLTEAEKARFKTLGEITGSIAHDLSHPINALSFCLDQFKEDRARIHQDRYFETLETNISRCKELVHSLRSSLRRDRSIETGFRFGDLHRSVLQVLRTQFKKDHFSSIQIQLDQELEELTLKMPRPEMSQILDNIYRNSIENFASKPVPNPKICIYTKHTDASRVQIEILENGSGLTREKFEQLTSFGFITPQSIKDPNNRGLGLRLTRRLVEQVGGQLDMREAEEGTIFQLSFLKEGPISSSNTINYQ